MCRDACDTLLVCGLGSVHVEDAGACEWGLATSEGLIVKSGLGLVPLPSLAGIAYQPRNVLLSHGVGGRPKL